jgi:hypothetical protein
MAIVWAWGWEVRAKIASYTNGAWASSGTADPDERTVFHQHPGGYGGGDTALSLTAGSWLRSAPLFSAPSGGGVNSTVRVVQPFDGASAVPLLAVYDTGGLEVVGVYAADTAASTRLTVKHNGVTVGTTSAILQPNQWKRLAARWAIAGGTVTVTLWLDGVQVLSRSTAKTTADAVDSVRWGAPVTGAGAAVYHDHTVVYGSSADAITAQTWVQGLRPNADDINGTWVPSGAATNWQALEDAADAAFTATATASTVQVNLQNRTAVNAAWTSPAVLAVQVDVAAAGDGLLPTGTAGMALGGSTASGAGTAMPAGGGLCSLLRTDKPGGSGWAAADLDNLALRYGAS